MAIVSKPRIANEIANGMVVSLKRGPVSPKLSLQLMMTDDDWPKSLKCIHMIARKRWESTAGESTNRQPLQR